MFALLRQQGSIPLDPFDILVATKADAGLELAKNDLQLLRNSRLATEDETLDIGTTN